MPQSGQHSIPTIENFINGRFSPAINHFDVSNPATHEMISRAPASEAGDVDRAIEAASAASGAWALRPAVDRAGFLRNIAQGIRRNNQHLATVISREQGKTLPLAEVEVNFTADYLDYMAEWARRIEGEVITSDRPNETILMLRKPVGVVAGILPWNFPFFLIARKMAPALVTGNTIVIKPSEETPNNCHEFARIAAESGLPDGVFNVVYGSGDIGARLAAHPDVDLISFTGSVRTGSAIMKAAAQNLTKVNLELGGKAPAIVLADADLDLAVKAIRDSRVINTGQVCNCAERVYVASAVADEFVAKIASSMKTVRYGDPLAGREIDMGPLVNRAGLDKVAAMVERAVADGATVVTGGERAASEAGFHYQPTVLANCKGEMEIMRDEIFGPVLPVQVVKDLDEAIALANASEYGLTSSVYTRSFSSAMQAVRELDFGETYVNRENFEAMQGFHAGVRKSGIGGADGKHGLYEYTHTHVVYMQG
ncbi:aldehyde dehydrogenase (plasmid) [Paraburkholderia sp. PGU19]|uniref:aldehyde dehydrogenase n=1 Tax=Paraburkholderia sp. PGU19 TaxID=2735434 RepID=UPI0015D96CE4|nr:aldehyde dehydrogenase [Paraburkholderia sp. PGU19]BCG04445.1 aldehyde dehydrogenase [Paraburkholderia sp. PGU19]